MCAAFKMINSSELKKKIDENDDFVLIDVRNKHEYLSGHIQGAINIPLDSIISNPELEGIKKDDVLVLYCRSGMRSAAASEKLVNAGYINVYSAGGIVNWPYPLSTKTV